MGKERAIAALVGHSATGNPSSRRTLGQQIPEGVRRASGAKRMKNLTILLGAFALLATTPSPAQYRGDEPVAVPRAVRQGIDFVYVDPQMSTVARKKQRPQNWLARMFSGDGGSGRQGAPNPLFVDLARGLQQYQSQLGIAAPDQDPGRRGAEARIDRQARRRAAHPPRPAAGGGYDEQLFARVAAYQQVHGLGPGDGIAGKATIASLNRGATYYERRIAINMERAYRLPAVRAFNRYVVVDSGAAETYLFDRDRMVDSMRVIVGAQDQDADDGGADAQRQGQSLLARPARAGEEPDRGQGQGNGPRLLRPVPL